MRKSYARCLDLVEAGLIRRTAAFTYEDAELGEVWDDVVYRLVDDGLLALGEDGSVHTTTSRARTSRRPGRPGAGSARRPSPIRSPPRPKGPAHDDDHDPAGISQNTTACWVLRYADGHEPTPRTWTLTRTTAARLRP